MADCDVSLNSKHYLRTPTGDSNLLKCPVKYQKDRTANEYYFEGDRCVATERFTPIAAAAISSSLLLLTVADVEATGTAVSAARAAVMTLASGEALETTERWRLAHLETGA